MRKRYVETEYEEESREIKGRYYQGENINTLLLNTIAHTLSHVESSISSVSMRLRELNGGLSEIRKLLNILVRASILRELPSRKAKKKLMLSILQELEE